MARNHSTGAERQPRSKEFFSSEVPLYYQLAAVLREQILSGRFAAGDRIPTEAELVEHYGVSRITVRQALSSLEQEGFVQRQVGRGTFVRERRTFSGELKVEGSLDDLISIGQFTSVKLVDLRTVKASGADAEVLGVEPGTPLTRCSRLRYWHKDPYCHIVVDLPADVGRRLARSDFKGSILGAIENKLGIGIRDAQQTVRASLADATLARMLETRIGAPLLAIDRVVVTDEGTPIEHVRTHYRSDIYSFAVHLHRDQGRHVWNAKTKPRA
ncbi:MAG: GntR family transcriptional regulator [Acidobacteria bacterium]|nr:GntR family transcriptional regulator [Acidobacteriota bacterium]